MKPEEALHRRLVAELRRTFGRLGYDKKTEPFFHCPNESMVPVRYRAKLNALGLSPGVPDLVIVHPVYIEGTLYPGMAIELKSRRGTASGPQLRWLGYWSAAGFYSAVLRGGPHTAEVMQSAGLLDHAQAERVRRAA